jgi:hypothetical protein
MSRKPKQLDMFESEAEKIAKNVIRRELLRFQNHPNKMPLVFAIIYREAMITRSKGRRKVYDEWLEENKQYNFYIQGRHHAS